ncbi:DUF4440 domain-containing protein [Botryobacter ruber]|uniref:DUF4440 domain-containing protein n=1 Tax=Botryobacter ruber TaxID=2171629 RepID=UPI000E0B71FF|nr:DUF4440 domain-containing protein [Botryobacter ruber]
MTTPPATTATAQVQQALDEQVNAWNAGDLETAMSYYWNSDDMLWISKTGVQRGYQPVLHEFLDDFKDRSRMGTYSYTPLHLEEIAPGIVFFVFSWKIELEGRQLMGTVSSQVWRKVDGRWVAVSEHAG